MKNYYTLFLFLIAGVTLFAQEDREMLRKELTEWDAVRGAWLAESFIAMSSDEAIPDRTFPENYTPAEMYSQVPVATRNRINQSLQTSTNGRQTNDRETTSNGPRPLGQVIPRNDCNLTMARTYGDPHISSFDGKKFSFQTVGEFVMAKSNTRNFEVQARQQPQSDQVSLNTAVAMNVHGDRVCIYASGYPDDDRSTPVRVEGRPVYLANQTYFLPKGGTIRNSGKNYVITWPSGEKVSVDMRRSGTMSFMNIAVNVFPCSDNFVGVLGNANGNPNDDFGEDNSRIAASSVFEPFGDRNFGRTDTKLEKQYMAFLTKEFAAQYRVTALTSLFDYGFGESTWTYTDESFPRVHLSVGDLSQTQRRDAERRCREQGITGDEMSGCVYDVSFANIEPSPRPVIEDITNGRELNPIDRPEPNVNKPEMLRSEQEVLPNGPRETISKPDVQPIENKKGEVNKETQEGNNASKELPVEKPEVVTKPIEKPIKQPEISKPTPVPSKPKPVIKPNPVIKPKPVVKPKPSPKPAPKTTVPKSTPKPTLNKGTFGR